MAITDAIVHYRRFLKRRNYSPHTIRNYMYTLRQFVLWVDVPIEQVTHKILLRYIDHLLDRRLRPKTINCHLDSIRGFYNYLIHEEQVAMVHPIKRGYALRLSRPLPRYLRDEYVARLFNVIGSRRDRAMFMLMLRCGLRVEEVANLKLASIDLRRMQLIVYEGKGRKDRLVYLSRDALQALIDQTQRVVNGTVRMKLYKGNVIVAGRKSPTHSLFDESIATFEDDAGAYDQKDAEGFIKLNALRLRVGARRKS